MCRSCRSSAAMMRSTYSSSSCTLTGCLFGGPPGPSSVSTSPARRSVSLMTTSVYSRSSALGQLPFEQLRGAANPAQRVLDLVCELANHLPAGAVLNQQRVLAADLGAPRHVGDLHQQAGVVRGYRHDRRHAAIDDTFFVVAPRSAQAAFRWRSDRRMAATRASMSRISGSSSTSCSSDCPRARRCADAENILGRRDSARRSTDVDRAE